jgi:hypothetical protein
MQAMFLVVLEAATQTVALQYTTNPFFFPSSKPQSREFNKVLHTESLCLVLGIESKASCILDKHCTTELYP